MISTDVQHQTIKWK